MYLLDELRPKRLTIAITKIAKLDELPNEKESDSSEYGDPYRGIPAKHGLGLRFLGLGGTVGGATNSGLGFGLGLALR